METDATQHAHIIAVTVTYGNRAELCSSTIRAALAAKADRVVVVINGADPAASSSLHRDWDNDARVIFVDLERNLGSAGGYAAGIAFSSDQWGPDSRLWLLDDDNLPHKDCLDRLVETAAGLEKKSESQFVLFSNRRSNPSHAKLADGIAVERVFPPVGSFVYFDILRRLNERQQRPGNPSPDIREIPYGPYGGMLIASRVASSSGGPTVSHFVYEDDTEFTYRLSRQGLKLVWVGSAHVDDNDPKWTDQAAGSGLVGMFTSRDSDRLYLAVRNRVYFDVLRCEEAGHFVRLACNGLVFTFVSVAVCLRYRRFRSLHIYGKALAGSFSMVMATKRTNVRSRAA